MGAGGWGLAASGQAARGPGRLLGQPVSPRWPLGGFLPEVSWCPDQDRVFSGEHFSVLSGLLILWECVTALAKAGGGLGGGGAHSSGRPPPSPAGADPRARGSRRTSWGPFRSSSSTKRHCPSSPLQNGSRALSRPAAPSSTLWAWGCGAQSGTFPAQRPLSPPKSWRQGKEKIISSHPYSTS